MQKSIFSSPKWLAVLITIYSLEYLVALFLSAPPERDNELTWSNKRLILIPSDATAQHLQDPAAPLNPDEWLNFSQQTNGSKTQSRSWATPQIPSPILAPGRQFTPKNSGVDGFSDLLTQRPDLPDLESPPNRLQPQAPRFLLHGALKNWRVELEIEPLTHPTGSPVSGRTSAEVILNGPGKPLSVTKTQSSGNSTLDQHAINALQQSHFVSPEPTPSRQSNPLIIGRIDVLWSDHP